jgi:hypothetical protein
MITFKPVEFGKMERMLMKVVDSQKPMPPARLFSDGEDILVRFQSGKYTVGRVKSFPQHGAAPILNVIFSTGRGTRVRKFEEDK